MKNTTIAILSAALIAAGTLNAGFLKWTGGAGTLNWADTGNWTATDGGGVDLTAKNSYDFSDLPAGSTVANTLALKIESLTFGANQGTITFSGTSANVEHYAGTWTIPAGTTLAYNMKYSQTYGDGGAVTITGAGTVQFSSTSLRASSKAWTLGGSVTMELYGNSSPFQWGAINVNGSSTIRLKANNTVGSISTTDGSISGTVEIGAYSLTLQAASKGNSAFGGKIVGAGALRVNGGQSMSAVSAWPDFTGRLSLANYSIAAGGTFDSSIRLVCEKSGVLTLTGNQTVAGLSGNGTSGGVAVPSGASLTVDGGSSGRAIYSARLTGAGGLVKDGAGSELVLAGANDCAGPIMVRGGTLTAAGAVRAYPSGLVNRWSFEGDSGRFDDSGPGSNPLYSWGGNAVPVFSANGVGGSQCVHFDRSVSSSMILRTSEFSHIRTNAHFTISMWFRPTQTALANGGYLFYGAYTESNAEAFSASVIVPGNSSGYTMAVGGFGWTTQRAVAADVWHHLAVAQDAERRVYLDGHLVNRKTLEWNVKACQLAIGNYPGWGSAFDGDIDEVLTFDRALSENEIKTLIDTPIPYATGERAAAILPAPVAHWSFDDSSVPGKDTSGNGYDLTAIGKIENQNGGAAGVPAGGKALKIVDHNNRGWLSWTGASWPEKIPSGGKAFSVSVRFAANWETGNGGPVFVMGDMSASKSYFSVMFGGDPKRCGPRFTNVDQVAAETTVDDPPGTGFTAPDSMSHHIYTWNPSTGAMTCYVDGRTERAIYSATGLNVSPQDIFIGYRNDGKSTSCFHGIIDDVQIFDRTLSADEARQLTLNLAGVSPTAASLPTNSAVTVESGARLCVRNAGEKIRALAGTGTLEMPTGASLAIAEQCTFPGAVSGGGVIDARAPISFTGDGGAFGGTLVWTNGASLSLPSSFTNCTIVLDQTRSIAVSAGGTVVPRYDLPGTYEIPSTGCVVFDGGVRNYSGDYVLATVGTIVAPASFDGWSFLPASEARKVKFFVDGGTFKVRVSCPNFLFSIR